jgi:hypothetical protein
MARAPVADRLLLDHDLKLENPIVVLPVSSTMVASLRRSAPVGAAGGHLRVRASAHRPVNHSDRPLTHPSTETNYD